MNLFSLKYRPLTIVIGFNLFTLIIFFTAPVRWATENLVPFLIFALLCQGMIIIGFQTGYKKYQNTDVSSSIFYKLSGKNLDFLFLFYSFTFLYKYAFLLKFNLFDIKGMISFLMLGIANPQTGYALSVDATRPDILNWYLYFFSSIINQVFFIVGFIKWKDLNLFKKCLFFFFILIELFYWMGRGTNFGVICLITTFAFSFIFKIKSLKLNFSQSVLFSFVFLFLLIASISVFNYNLKNRSDNYEIDALQFSFGSSEVDEDHYMFSLIPRSQHTSYMYLVSYLTQGYYHTCLAFDLDYKPTYFVGNNPALISLANLFKIDVWKDTYMVRLESKGVDPLVNWHSAYTWYASDFTFFGVPFLLCLIGYFFGISWALSIYNNDLFSKIMFIIFGNMLLYLFANNSYLANVFYSFIFILPLWFFTRVIKLVYR